jgi:hypothetical protein
VTGEDDIAHWDAAYALGALSAADRREYEAYLAANPDRAAGLSEFTELASILDALSPKEALALLDEPDSQVEEPKTLDFMPALAQAAERRQRRSRRNVMLMMTATAAAFLAVGVIVTATIAGRSQSSTPTLSAMGQSGRPGVTAELAVTEKKWGTRLDWQCQYTKDWSRNVASYDMVVTTVDGTQTTVGSWRPEGSETTGLAAATVIPKSQIRSVDIRVAGTNEKLAVTTLS